MEINNTQLLNPSLAPFSALIGDWDATGTHPKLPGITLRGRTSFNWLEGGAFLIMHSKMDGGQIPSGTAIFGSDNTKEELFMLYFDDRKVSRKYNVLFENSVLKWWRDGPEFSQRYSFVFADQGNSIISRGEISLDGQTWEQDLDLVYTRI